jgi:hypothetical protein
MSLICILLIISPTVFSSTSAKIDDQGLKAVQIRAGILKTGGPVGHGHKHGQVQAMVREVEPQVYSYKFMIDLKKATPNKEYTIHMWADVPEIEITIYADYTSPAQNPNWFALQLAMLWLELDMDLTFNDQITINTNILGLTGMQTANLQKSFVTDHRGNYKNMKTGIIAEMDAIEYTTDLAWPHLRQYLIDNFPEYPVSELLPAEIDFSIFKILGFTIPAGSYTISGGLNFVGVGGDSYYTETVTYTYTTSGFEWWF